jgi:hypothetical protein
MRRFELFMFVRDEYQQSWDDGYAWQDSTLSRAAYSYLQAIASSATLWLERVGPLRVVVAKSNGTLSLLLSITDNQASTA